MVNLYLAGMQTDLPPGIYKIKEKEMLKSYHNKRTLTQVVHLLRVVGIGDRCKYYIDHDPFGQHPHKMNFNHDYEVMKKYSGLPEMGKARITITFSDDAGDAFEFAMSDVWMLRDLLDEIPWLKKTFGFEPRKKGKLVK